ncbi:DUF742 domain-containing protein [Nocardia anaemiae]|uniref:DUF742 domain-containing protein n=1 Tax=Nocardia anaemiae TaxID=263910 RepID=UPI0007A45505|nr:DUF742 domain-containing protein [Nocardia anaemiae]
MSDRRHSWFDDAAGPLVRPFAVTRGRTRSSRADLEVSTQVMTVCAASPSQGMDPEHREILQLCAKPQAVAEVSARLQLPLMVTKILISDLIVYGCLVFRPSVPQASADIDTLRAVLNGIRKL